MLFLPSLLFCNFKKLNDLKKMKNIYLEYVLAHTES